MSEKHPALLQVTTTCDDRSVLERIANDLVTGRLAACVQLSGPVQSTYSWKSKIEQSTEWMLTIKTTISHWSAVQQAIQERHSYDVPEIIATPIVTASEPYADWVRGQLDVPST